MNRRSFLYRSAAAASVVSIQHFNILSAQAKGANERVNVAFIGAGGKGAHAIRSLENNELVNFVAFAT